MTMDTAPGWNVVHYAGICGQDPQQVAALQAADGVLGPDHGNRTEQAARIKVVQGRLAHRYQASGTSPVRIGTTFS
ncbi:MAG: hypothetical protein K0Q68_1748 [Moraxellaceae bacterium]|nr:hypothetical protein [Moraxellaceae bacterium]